MHAPAFSVAALPQAGCITFLVPYSAPASFPFAPCPCEIRRTATTTHPAARSRSLQLRTTLPPRSLGPSHHARRRGRRRGGYWGRATPRNAPALDATSKCHPSAVPGKQGPALQQAKCYGCTALLCGVGWGGFLRSGGGRGCLRSGAPPLRAAGCVLRAAGCKLRVLPASAEHCADALPKFARKLAAQVYADAHKGGAVEVLHTPSSLLPVRPCVAGPVQGGF